MKRAVISTAILAVVFASFAAIAETRSAGDYSLTAEILDAGGGTVSSADYSSDSSIGAIIGISVADSPPETIKAGYVGQLYDLVGLSVWASPTNVDEGTSRQLGATGSLDDGTFLALPGSNVAWSVLSGPIGSISAAGLAAANHVYRDTPAALGGSAGGFSASLGLLVANVTSDDCGLYAGDGIDDDWQVTYFGEDNPAAAAGEDPDRDGRDNLFESIALTVPTNAGSCFGLHPAQGPPGPGKMVLVYGPIQPGRSYTVLYSMDLLPSGWNKLTGAVWHDGDYDYITDEDAGGPRKFYKVKIEKSDP